MSFELQVLGSSPAWPNPNRACSGYILRVDGMVLLLDCGTGVFERLRAVMPPEQVDGILISHLHFDHWADLIPYRHYLNYEVSVDRGPDLHLPPGAPTRIQQSVEAIDSGAAFFSGTFPIFEYEPQAELILQGLRVRFHKTQHPIETYAMRLEAGGRSLVYSADTGWDPSLTDFCRGAELFLCEAASGATGGGGPIHLGGDEAGRIATLASAGRLLLTHILQSQVEAAIAGARQEYAGQVDHAVEGLHIRL